jgi:hypothetical protein
MNDYSVPIAPLRVTMLLTDGRTIDGDVFLPAKSPLRDGPMLAGEWAKVAPPFIPVRPAVGHEVMIVNRHQVVAFALPAGVPAEDPVELLDTPAQHVSREMTGGLRLEGLMAVAMPRHQRRVVDWLNAQDAHLTLEVDGRAHLVTKAHIVRIIELGGA